MKTKDCTLIYTSKFKKQYKKVYKQGKDIDKVDSIINKLAKREELDSKYKDHKLISNKYYIDCRECHIEPDLLLIYQYDNNDLLLISIGSHSELFI